MENNAKNSWTKPIIWLVVIVLVVWGGYLVFSKNFQNVTAIKIGYIGPLTGDAASVGEAGFAAAQYAVKELNDKGGILGKKVELVSEDDNCTAKGGADAMNKLVNFDKVIAITGPDCGSAAGSAIPIAQKAKIPTVVRWASVPNLTKIGNYIFRNYPSDAFQGVYAANYIFNRLGKKNVAVLYVQNDYGQGLKNTFVSEYAKLGGKIVFEEGHNQEATDLRTAIEKVKSSKAEAIFFPSYRAIGAIGLKQMKELGIKVPIVAGDAFDADEIILSPSSEGVLYAVAVTNNPEDLQKKIEQFTGKKANKITAPLAYDAINIIAEAIKKASKVDKELIRKELETTSYKGVSYQVIEFDQDRDFKGGDYQMMTVRNKKSVKYELQ